MKNKEDILQHLFRKMQREEPPVTFRNSVMQQILQEAMKKKKREERLGLFAVIFSSLVIISLGIAGLVYLDFKTLHIHIPDFSTAPFYIYIGILGLILLAFDHLMRKAYYKKHNNETL